MKIIAFSQRVLRAPGSGREWTRDRPTGPRTLLVSLIVNPLGATVVTWVTNWPRRCIHTLSLTHSPRVGP